MEIVTFRTSCMKVSMVNEKAYGSNVDCQYDWKKNKEY